MIHGNRAEKPGRSAIGNYSAELGEVVVLTGTLLSSAGLTASRWGYLYLEVLLHTDKPPEELFRHVAVTFAKK